MPITSLSLLINGTTVDLSPTVNTPRPVVTVNEFTTWAKDSPLTLSFVRESVLPEDDPWVDASVELSVNGSLVFFGRVRRREFGYSDGAGYTYLYTAIGMEYHGDDIPVVSPFDGTGTASFNLDPASLDYDPTYSGLSIGAMIRLVLEQNDTASLLNAVGIGRYTVITANSTTYTLDSRTVADLANDTYLSTAIPPKPITFQGDTLFQSIRSVLQGIAPNHLMWVQYLKDYPPGTAANLTNYGIIRFSDLRTITSTKTLTIGTDPQPKLRRDYSQTYGRVIIRGGPNVQPIVLQSSKGEISEAFNISPFYANNTAAKNAWKLSIWTQNSNLTVEGTCLCRRPRTANEANSSSGQYRADPPNASLADPNWLYVDPNNNNLTWNADVWGQASNKYAGYVYANAETIKSGVTVQSSVVRTVSTNTNLTANGKSHLQMSSPLPTTDFNNFTMVAKLTPGVQTWRRYKINGFLDAGKPIGKYVQSVFPFAIPWINGDGTVASFTNSGVGQIQWEQTANSGIYESALLNFQVDRSTETIVFNRPTVSVFNSAASLSLGGANVTAPVNIRLLLPVSIGSLQATIPSDTVSGNTTTPNYEGTGNTVDGLTRTMYVTNRDWINDADTSLMRQWGLQILDSQKDTIVEGSAIRYDYDPIQTPGIAIAIVDPCHTNNPYANMTSQASGCLIRFNHSGAIPYHTEYQISNRRAPFQPFDSYLHPHLMTQAMADTMTGRYSSDFKQSQGSNDIEDRAAMGKANAQFDSAGLAENYDRKTAAGIDVSRDEMAGKTVENSIEAARMAQINQMDYLND